MNAVRKVLCHERRFFMDYVARCPSCNQQMMEMGLSSGFQPVLIMRNRAKNQG